MGQYAEILDLKQQVEPTDRAIISQMVTMVGHFMGHNIAGTICYIYLNNQQQASIRFAKMNKQGRTVFAEESKINPTKRELASFRERISRRLTFQHFNDNVFKGSLKQLPNQPITFKSKINGTV